MTSKSPPRICAQCRLTHIRFRARAQFDSFRYDECVQLNTEQVYDFNQNELHIIFTVDDSQCSSRIALIAGLTVAAFVLLVIAAIVVVRMHISTQSSTYPFIHCQNPKMRSQVN
jgi:hypothetical protein